MGLFGKKNKNKEKGVPFWKRNKQKQEEELVQEELTEQESPAEESDRAFAGEEEDIAAAAIREQDEVRKPVLRHRQWWKNQNSTRRQLPWHGRRHWRLPGF